MVDFTDFDVETQDQKDRETEHSNGDVTTAGTPETVSTTSGKSIQLAYINNPSRGPNGNSPGDLLYISWDGGTTFITLTRGSWIIWPGKGSGTDGQSIVLDSNNDGVKYEIMLVS